MFSVETVQYSVEKKINMNVRLGINLKLFKGDRQIYIQMKAYVFPCQDNINFEFGQWLHTLRTLRVHLALLQLAGVLSGNNTILYEEKNKYECTFGYNFRSFQGRPTNVYPNESLGSPLSE